MEFLIKIENAINFLETEKNKNVDVNLTYAELKDIRKHILIDNFSTDLSAENLRAGMKFAKSLKTSTSHFD